MAADDGDYDKVLKDSRTTGRRASRVRALTEAEGEGENTIAKKDAVVRKKKIKIKEK